MGYRARVYLLDNIKIAELQQMTKSRLYNKCKKYLEDGYLYRGDLLDEYKAKEIMSLGSPAWDYRIMNKYLTPLFENKILHDQFNQDSELMLLDKEGLGYLIDFYRGELDNYYKKSSKCASTVFDVFNLLFQKQETFSKEEIFKIVRDAGFSDGDFAEGLMSLKRNNLSMSLSWEKDNPPYNLGKESLSSSWIYDHIIFELVRLYKEVDFTKNTMIYTAG